MVTSVHRNPTTAETGVRQETKMQYMTFANFNKERALRIYRLNVKKAEEMQHKKLLALNKRLRKSGLISSSEGLEEFNALAREKIQQKSEIFLNATLAAVESGKIISEETKDEVRKQLYAFVDKELAQENMAVRQRLARCNETGSFTESFVNDLARAAQELKGDLEDRIEEEVYSRNESAKSKTEQDKKPTIPNLDWYLGKSKTFDLSPRCPFANADKCPRYYESLSLLGNAGYSKIPLKLDRKLQRKWEKSPLSPVTKEQATGITHVDNQPKHYHNFCPEVSFENLELFASDLQSYSDEIDLQNAHRMLSEGNVPSGDWHWYWAYVRPKHYSECPLYSVLMNKENSVRKEEDIIELKPNFFGLGVNLNAFWRRLNPFERKKL